MNTGSGLPTDVIAALHEGQKVQAIKLLRAQRGIGLKEAKDEVEAYLKEHPELATMQKSGNPIGCFAWIGLIGVVGYLLYTNFIQ